MRSAVLEMRRWLLRTPVQTFIVCPFAVVVFELALHHGGMVLVPWGSGLVVWGSLQYLLVGNYRLPRAGGGRGMQPPPDRIITSGPYRYTRNPMYLGHLIFMMGLALTLWSWFALILLAARAAWFHHRVLRDEHRLEAHFPIAYAAYRSKVSRWIPGIL